MTKSVMTKERAAVVLGASGVISSVLTGTRSDFDAVKPFIPWAQEVLPPGSPFRSQVLEALEVVSGIMPREVSIGSPPQE